MLDPHLYSKIVILYRDDGNGKGIILSAIDRSFVGAVGSIPNRTLSKE